MKTLSLWRKVFAFLFIFSLFITFTSSISAQLRVKTYDDLDPDQLACGCRDELSTVYASGKMNDKDGRPHRCVTTYEEFLQDPQHNHFWIEDPEITSQGKADERARQFIFWVLHRNAIDDHPAIRRIWNLTRNLSYFFVVIMAAVIGLGFIIGQKTNFSIKIKVWPAIWKIMLAIIYITFSAAIVLTMIQLSELLMKFFIENLGGDKLFNIYFSTQTSNEKSYLDFIGCRDINIRAQEGVQAEVMLLKLTNITYYVMGSMILLRKILLWFLLFVSPFLAILMPFVFIRNIGWIWIGVFFQWLFYGPLFALFLSALAYIWKSGIPFAFDFSRVNNVQNNGYVYPTAINILYGGPAQKLQILNNGNYVDTFVEYIITLLMLWAVTFFPWWLLRIFRDYCCDILAAMNNVLLSMYDQWRANFPPIIPPGMPPGVVTGTAKQLPILVDRGSVIPTGSARDERPLPNVVRIETIEEIKRAKTEDIVRSLNFSVSKLTDIARFETNKTLKESVKKNIDFLANPVKANVPVERQKYMNIRTELFSRAVKEDRIARAILSSTSTSQIEQMKKKEEILKTASQPIAMVRVISDATKMTQEKVRTITQSFMESMSKQTSVVSNISQVTQIPQQTVQNIMTTYSQSINKPMNQVIKNISEQTHISKEKVSQVLQQATNMTQQANTINRVATTNQMSNETIENILNTLPGVHEESQSTQINQTTINQISQQTGMATEKVSEVVHEIQQQSVTQERIKEIAEKTQVKESEVQKISETVKTTQTQQVPITKLISMKSNISEEKATAITNSLINTAATNSSVVQHIQQETGLNQSQVKTVLNTYSQNVNQPASVIESKITQATGLQKEKVNQVLKQAMKTVSSDIITSKNIVQEVAKKENTKVEDVQHVVEAQEPLVTAPEKQVEKTISIPSSISLEDYEEVKKMWVQQYEKGEVPLQENIGTREQWIDQDIALITNTLNKLLAPDDTLRREGLDDLGFILPIFMINNLKGEELLVYLKAKLEAAKAVQQDITKEKEIRDKLKEENKDDEELVDLKKAKKEEKPKELHMELEMEDEKKEGQQEAGEEKSAEAPAENTPQTPLEDKSTQ
ncbi:MAG: hypothetical protein RI947_753 [Candidatus Parcubacteria bacterium]|jgi:hypothetical protein